MINTSQGPWSLVALILLALTAVAGAQSASLPLAVYRPGRYVPLQITADAPGDIRIRGDRIQGIDWPAPGRGNVVVPLLIYGDADGLSLSINDRPVHFELHALADDDADPAELTAFWAAVDPRPPGPAPMDEDAAAAAALWQPDRDPATRRWALLAVGVIVLTLGVAAHVDPKRATRWLVLTAGGLAVGVVLYFPADAPRRVLAAEGRPGWEWVWHAARAPRDADEPWTAGLRCVATSAAGLKAADPVLHCDAAGRPVAITCRIERDGRAVFLRAKTRAN